MKVIKEGQQRLFETDQETVATVSRMLLDLERNGMDAVRKYSRQFDEWDPPDFQLTRQQIDDAVASLPEQALRDTDYCQSNVRRFAQAQCGPRRRVDLVPVMHFDDLDVVRRPQRARSGFDQ